MSSKKGKVFKNTNKKNRHGTNCNDSNRVITGRSPNDPIPYSFSVQKSVEHYITKYQLKCSLLRFPMLAPWSKLIGHNKVSNEFIDTFASRINWSIACRSQKLSEALMDKYSHLMDWSQASHYQKFSKKFIVKHIDDLEMDVIMNHRFLISQEEIEPLKKLKKEKEEFLKDGEEIEDRFDILDM